MLFQLFDFRNIFLSFCQNLKRKNYTTETKRQFLSSALARWRHVMRSTEDPVSTDYLTGQCPFPIMPTHSPLVCAFHTKHIFKKHKYSLGRALAVLQWLVHGYRLQSHGFHAVLQAECDAGVFLPSLSPPREKRLRHSR